MMLATERDALVEELVSHGGVEYKTFMQRLATHFGAERYFEIGTQNGISLSMMPCDSIAVDPSFLIDRPVMAAKKICMLFQMTSDRFFERHNPAALLGGPIDIAFLDGMHRFEYLLRDFANIEQFCKPNSLVCLHDCLPPTLEMTVRPDQASTLSEKYRGYWTGDVWKVVPLLKQARPDLRIHFIDCPPTGLIICTNLDPTNVVLKERHFELVESAFRGSEYDNLRAMFASQPMLSSKELSTSENLTRYFWL